MQTYIFKANDRRVTVQVCETSTETLASVRRDQPLDPQTFGHFMRWFDPLLTELLSKPATIIETPVGYCCARTGPGLSCDMFHFGDHLEAYLTGSPRGVPLMRACRVTAE